MLVCVGDYESFALRLDAPWTICEVLNSNLRNEDTVFHLQVIQTQMATMDAKEVFQILHVRENRVLVFHLPSYARAFL